MKYTDPPIIVEHSYHTTLEKAWVAISNHDQMLHWFFDNIPDFKAEVGFETQFAVTVQERTFTHLWRITDVSPKSMITYNWKYKEYPGEAFATFELTSLKSQVHLSLVMHVIKSFPENIPEFSRDSCVAGWNYFLGKRLKEFLEK